MPSAGTDLWASSVPMGLTMAVAVLLVLLRIGDLQNIATMLPASFIRWKECVSLFNSVSMNRSKNRVARAMILPFILICTRFDLFPPAAGWARELGGTPAADPFITTLIVAGVFAAYLILRELCIVCFKGKKIERTEMKCACNSVYIFFISAVTLMFLTSGICTLFAANQEVIRKILLWILAVVYSICLLRKTQIFAYYRGFLAGILYLCTLEFLPTGLLIVSSLLF